MVDEIREIARIDKDGSHFDPLVIQKWIEQGDVQRLKHLVSLEKFIRHIHAMSESSLQKGLSSSHGGELSDLFFATIQGLRQGSRIPNIWQFHLLKLVKKCGYRDEEIVQVVKAFYTGLQEDALEHMNIAARHLGLGTIFDRPKK